MPETPDPLTIDGMLSILRNDLEEKKAEIKEAEERLKAQQLDLKRLVTERDTIRKYITIIEVRTK